MDTTIQFYNRLARTYDRVTASRISYLDAVDNLILQHAGDVEAYLDIGAGDGRRSLKIARGVDASHVALLDGSSEISRNISPSDNMELFIGYLENYRPGRKFDLVTSLWNVMGHVGAKAERLRFLVDCENLLAANGLLVIDVNNRYNIAHYGNQNVMRNLEKDIRSDSTSGTFELGLDQIKTEVYVHAPFEMNALLEQTGLEVKHEFYVDYDNGEIKPSCFEGQLLYFIGHRN